MVCRPTARSSCALMWRPSVAASCSSGCAGLRPGDEPRRMHLGLPQASRHAQLLRHERQPSRPARSEEPALDAATRHTRDRIPESGGPALMSYVLAQDSRIAEYRGDGGRVTAAARGRRGLGAGPHASAGLTTVDGGCHRVRRDVGQSAQVHRAARGPGRSAIRFHPDQTGSRSDHRPASSA